MIFLNSSPKTFGHASHSPQIANADCGASRREALVRSESVSPVGGHTEGRPAHVRELGLDLADDIVIWNRAKRDRFCIVSKDDDFLQRSSLEGAPPKVIWLRVGNCPTERIEALLRRRLSEIAEFNSDSDLAFLVLS